MVLAILALMLVGVTSEQQLLPPLIAQMLLQDAPQQLALMERVQPLKPLPLVLIVPPVFKHAEELLLQMLLVV
jgi:hypothetical protein